MKLSVKSTLWTLQEGKRKCEPRNLIGNGQIFFIGVANKNSFLVLNYLYRGHKQVKCLESVVLYYNM